MTGIAAVHVYSAKFFRVFPEIIIHEIKRKLSFILIKVDRFADMVDRLSLALMVSADQ